MCISSVLKVSVVYSAPMVPFAASTTVGHMAAIAAPCQSTLTKRRNAKFLASFGCGHGSRRENQEAI